MPIVEMVGPSGVGKTTLAKAVLERMSASGWQSQYDALRKVLGNNMMWPSPTVSLHRHLLGLKYHDGAHPPEHPVIRETEMWQINMELACSVNLPEALVLADEFVVMHFMRQFIDLAQTDRTSALALLAFRQVIFLRNEPQRNLAQFRTRQQQGIARPYIDDMTDDAFIAYAQAFDAEMMAFRRLLTEAGGTSTVLDLRAGDDDCVAACCDFLTQVANA